MNENGSSNSPRQPEKFHAKDRANEQQQDWLVGKKAVLEQLVADASRVEQVLLLKGRPSKQFREIMDACHAAGVRTQWREANWFENLGPAGKQGVAARVSAAAYLDGVTLLTQALDAPLPVVLMLDQVQDTQNVGTMVRSAWALGAGGIIMPKHNAAHLGAGAARAAAGALHKLPIARVTNLSRTLEQAEAAGWQCLALRRPKDGAPDDTPAVSLWELPLRFPLCFVLGGEDRGVRPGVAKACEASVWIPLPRESDSLNVAQAAAMALAAAAMRQTQRM